MDPSPLVGHVEHRGRDAGRSAAVVVLIAVLALAGAGVFATSSSARSFFPKQWDPNVAPIAAEVATLRGLDFEHPVVIRYLAPKDFEKQVGGNDQPSADDRVEIDHEEAVFRALGFIGGKVDLLKEAQTQSTSDTLAYYDPTTQEIFVRGTTLDVEHRVTVAHELTHVLQDQHFDLQKLQQAAFDSKSTSYSGLKGLIEGDAVRIEQEYLKQLSPADQAAYAREDAAEGTRVRKETSSVPDILEVLEGAPYEFGPLTVRVLEASGGNRAVDDALTGEPPSSGVFIRTGDASPGLEVSAPPPPADSVTVGSTDSFGSFETFLTLANRVDPVLALSAADIVAGGEAVTYRLGPDTCYRVAIEPRAGSNLSFLVGAFEKWAKGRAQTTVSSTGTQAEFTACDPGAGAPVPDPKPLNSAVTLLAVRASLTLGAASANIPAAFARCVGRVFVERPGAEGLVLAVGNGRPTAQQTAQVRRIVAASAVACRTDDTAGMR